MTLKVVSRMSEGVACPLGAQFIVMGSHSEVVYRCPFCVCLFSTFSDSEAHLDAFGRVGSVHREAWDKELLRRDAEHGVSDGADKVVRDIAWIVRRRG